MTADEDKRWLEGYLDDKIAERNGNQRRHQNVRRLVAKEAIADLDGGGELVERAHLVDWGKFWARDHSDQEWTAPPLFPKGQAVVVYAPAKEGKSEVVCAVVFALVTGRPIFGRHPMPPVHVLYLDYEMTEEDLYERLTDHGYGPDDDLSYLHYASLPSLPPLDTAAGADAVLSLVEHTGATVVVVDTFGRATEGDENENDTVRAFYRHTGLALKAAGVGVIRTDHAGKDPSKGQRGASGKADDVDIVWSLKRVEGGAELTRTHTRHSWISDKVALTRLESDEGIISYRYNESGTVYPEGTGPLAKILDKLELPLSVTAKVATEALKEAGQSKRRTLVLAAIRWRQQEAESRFGAVDNSMKRAGTAPGTALGNRPAGTVGTETTNTQVDDPEPSPEPSGTTAVGVWEPRGVTIKEPPGSHPGPDSPESHQTEEMF